MYVVVAAASMVIFCERELSPWPQGWWSSMPHRTHWCNCTTCSRITMGRQYLVSPRNALGYAVLGHNAMHPSGAMLLNVVVCFVCPSKLDVCCAKVIYYAAMCLCHTCGTARSALARDTLCGLTPFSVRGCTIYTQQPLATSWRWCTHEGRNRGGLDLRVESEYIIFNFCQACFNWMKLKGIDGGGVVNSPSCVTPNWPGKVDYHVS